MDHTLVAHSGHSKECKVRIVVEMEKDETKHRVRTLYAADGIDQGEVSSKDHDEGKAGKGGTPEKARAKSNQLRRAHVRPSSSSTVATRGTTKKHGDE